MSSSQVPSIPFRNVQPKASHGKPAETSVTAATLQNTSQSFTKNFDFTKGDMIGVANNAPIRESFKAFNPDQVLRPGRSLRAFGQQNVQFNKSTQKTFAPKGDRSLRGGPRLPINPFAGQAATLGVSINAPVSELAIAPSVLAVNFPQRREGQANDTVPRAPGVPSAQTLQSQVFGQNYPMADYGKQNGERGGRGNNINNVFNSGSTSLLEPNAFAPENDEQALSYTGDVLSKGLRAGGYRVAPRQQLDNEAGALAAFPNNAPFSALGAVLSGRITTGGTAWVAGDVGTEYDMILITPSPDRSLIIREPQPHPFSGGVARGEVTIVEVTAGAVTKINARLSSVGYVPGDVVRINSGVANKNLQFTVLAVQTSAEPAEEQHDNPVPFQTLSQINPPAPKTVVNDNNGRVQYEFQNARSSNPSLSIISQDLTASATKAYFDTLSGEFVYGGFSMKAGGI